MYACSGASGLGVYIGGDSAAELIENVITENSGFANGGGVTLFAAGRAVLRSNVIARNITGGFSPCTSGGGIWMVNFSQATIVNNLVVGNAAGCGGGFYWGGSTGVTTFVNNTFADNDGAEGSAIEMSGVDTRHVIYNNLIIGKAGQTALYCRNSPTTPSPVVNTSNVFSAGGLAYGGTCADQTGQRGNISVDPLFVQAALRRHARRLPPAVRTLRRSMPGDNAAPQLPATDLDGNARIFDGNLRRRSSRRHGSVRVHDDEYAASCRTPAPIRRWPRMRAVVASVTLDGSVSSDPDGDQSDVHVDRIVWHRVGRAPTVALPAGVHVDHADGLGRPRRLDVRHGHRHRRGRNRAGRFSPRRPRRRCYAPANHQFVAVTVTVSASDGCGGSVYCRITSVTSNEPVDGEDWVITGDLTLNLRAGATTRTGRIYTITIVIARM